MRTKIDPAWWASGRWEGQPIHEFLARRDITGIFCFLHARGVSYSAIAALVDVTPSRVAEIAKGARQVTAYEVLERIALGLRIPRSFMGLSYDQNKGSDRDGVTPPDSQGPNDVPSLVIARDGMGSDQSTAARLRADLDEALASSSVTPRQLELIEGATTDYMETYPSAPPKMMLPLLLAECAEVRVLSRRRQPAAIQARLSGIAALLATMCADALMRLGDVGEARLWYRTALHAADDSARPQLRVLVRAQAAMLPYYFGNPRQIISLADAALAVTAPPASSTALAAAGRARALARMNDVDQARTAIDQARRIFDQVGDDDSDAAFRFPLKRLLLYLSGAHTWLGDTKRAYQAQDDALRLYSASASAPIDPALIALDRSICLVQDHRITEAAATAHEAIEDLPETQRTEIILTRASDVVSAVPDKHRQRIVAALADYVHDCRKRARTLASGTAVLDP